MGEISNPYAAGKAVAEKLAGTANETIESALTDLGLPLGVRDDPAFVLAFDESVFECDCCGWWCWTEEQSEREGEFFCDDCAS